MLKKSSRLSSEEVTNTQSKGSRASFGRLRLSWCLRSDRATSSRFALVVSKKVAKTAVARNTLRRRAYTHLSSVKLPRPIDAVIFILESYTTYDLLVKDVDGLLARVTEKMPKVQ